MPSICDARPPGRIGAGLGGASSGMEIRRDRGAAARAGRGDVTTRGNLPRLNAVCKLSVGAYAPYLCQLAQVATPGWSGLELVPSRAPYDVQRTQNALPSSVSCAVDRVHNVVGVRLMPTTSTSSAACSFLTAHRTCSPSNPKSVASSVAPRGRSSSAMRMRSRFGYPSATRKASGSRAAVISRARYGTLGPPSPAASSFAVCRTNVCAVPSASLTVAAAPAKSSSGTARR